MIDIDFDDGREYFTATVPLDLKKVQAAIEPEKRFAALALQVAHHGARIAAIDKDDERRDARMNKTEENVDELRRAMRVLQWCMAIGLFLLIVAVWR